MGEDVLRFASRRKKTRREERKSMGSRRYHNHARRCSTMDEPKGLRCQHTNLTMFTADMRDFFLMGRNWDGVICALDLLHGTTHGLARCWCLFISRWASLFLLGVGCSTLPGEALYSSSVAVLLVSWNGPGGKRGEEGRFDSSS